MGCFRKDCEFTDPTISFRGLDRFISNVQNLRIVVDALTESDDAGSNGCRSDLWEIELSDEFVKTRWNMVGELSRLPWRPRIDVVGNTKFWFTDDSIDGESSFQVQRYDESWEVPASQALLQLITPGSMTPWNNKTPLL